jgi:1,2-dihydroxy-3-keto-5-methylthiopentene dioxygenase
LSQLQIFLAAPSQPVAPVVSSQDPARIATELALRGIGFERWSASRGLPAGASPEQVLEAYADDIARVQARGSYPTVDAIRMTPDHPDRQALRQKFLAEHTHGEDEVRFFVEGRGLFCLHIGDEVLQILCEAADFLSVPAGTKHWFDMGEAPHFSAIRFFDNPQGWVADFTGDPIAAAFPTLDELLN